MSTNPNSKVRLVEEESFEEMPPLPQADVVRSAPTPSPQPRAMAAPSSPRSSPAFLQQMTAMLAAISTVIAARLLLLLAGVGAFLLSWATVQDPTTGRLMACAIYDAVVFLPMVWLYARRGGND